jgi:hypothetical protein
MSSVTLPLVCLTAAAAGVVRRYLSQQEQRIRRLHAHLARQHDERERELDRREADLARREELLQRTRFTTDLRVRSAYARMDIMLDELAAERDAHHELKVEYDQLARDYNEVLLESAGAPPAEVQHAPVAVGQIGTAGNGHGLRHIPQRRGPRPFLTVVEDAGEYQESG